MKKDKKAEKQKKLRKLDMHDASNYYTDLEYLGRLSYIPERTRLWIEDRMYELRDSANVFEHRFGEFLISKKVEFIHQAPFVFRPRTIYFVDFYLPKQRVVIEIDGVYHSGQTQSFKDRERDANFSSIGIRVVRVSNAETKDTKTLALRLSQFIK